MLHSMSILNGLRIESTVLVVREIDRDTLSTVHTDSRHKYTELDNQFGNSIQSC